MRFFTIRSSKGWLCLFLLLIGPTVLSAMAAKRLPFEQNPYYNGRPTACLCQDFACQRPQMIPAGLHNLFGRLLSSIES